MRAGALIHRNWRCGCSCTHLSNSEQDDCGRQTSKPLHKHLEGGGGEVLLGVFRVHEGHAGQPRDRSGLLVARTCRAPQFVGVGVHTDHLVVGCLQHIEGALSVFDPSTLFWE